MAEATPFKLKHRHLQAIIRILNGYTSADADGESDVNLDAKAKDDLSLCSRTLNSGVAGTAAKDTEGKTVPTEGGEPSGNANHAENARGTGNDAAATSRVVAAARDSRMNGAGSPFAGVPDYIPGRAPPLARDGSIISIDSLFHRDGAGSAASVSIDDVFGKQPPTLANG